ncbi:TIGR03086 family metal-binding protein [Streptomyces iconiensis]|uniref:TIGR03086 family metal-binding protein n=1 Tax=Streptomyces iconiensis TaxID=1384038 RepID=A0ABT7A4F8_9ACTN|nr:TIGR03086 family metal-binding protein [Streptomyces iconiensis]MDJ1136191.1 TIGR03086 family metal-binding protein [Streptomyces iconiensis]
MTDVRIDLEPAAREMAALAEGVEDAALGDATPCEQYAVRDLLEHVIELAVAFRDAARKDLGPTTGRDPAKAQGTLGADWRARLPERLEEMATSWRNPAAWEGTTQAGGVTMAAPTTGAFALDELVVHGWDLARATGQDFTSDEESLRTVHALLAGAVSEDGKQGAFGPVAAVAPDAPLLDRVVALAGRDPGWAPPVQRASM